MPCNSDYLAPNARERELQRAAKFLAYVYEQTGRVVDESIQATADNDYATDDYVSELCQVLKLMSKADREKVIYGRSRTARELANWWEDHLEADRARKTEERKATKEEKLRESALAKLTPAERRALGIFR